MMVALDHPGGPFDRLTGEGIEVRDVGHSDCPVVVVARHNLLGHLPNPRTTRVGIGSVANEVTQADDPTDRLAGEVLKDRLEGLQVAMDVGENGDPHPSPSSRLSSQVRPYVLAIARSHIGTSRTSNP